MDTDIEFERTADATFITPADSDETPRMTSEKLGTPIKRRDAERFFAFAVERGGRIDLTDENYAALEAPPFRISKSRVPACVCNLKKFYGVDIISERDGRRVVTYAMNIGTPLVPVQHNAPKAARKAKAKTPTEPTTSEAPSTPAPASQWLARD